MNIFVREPHRIPLGFRLRENLSKSIDKHILIWYTDAG